MMKIAVPQPRKRPPAMSSPLVTPCPPIRLGTPAAAIEAYIRGKDGNRPHLLRAAFTDDARLAMHVRTAGISFPPGAAGRHAIAELLVRQFNQTWENVYTVCIGDPPDPAARSFSCNWLVAMSAKADLGARLGCGRYDWVFDVRTGLAQSLVITIEAMVASAERADAIADWAAALDYPWCSPRQLEADPPEAPALRSVLATLRARL